MVSQVYNYLFWGLAVCIRVIREGWVCCAIFGK